MSFIGTRRIRLTRLKLVGLGQKWVPMRLGLSACEKWSTLLLKGERDLACNSTTVLTMESHFLEKVKRSDLTAFNYSSLIHCSVHTTENFLGTHFNMRGPFQSRLCQYGWNPSGSRHESWSAEAQIISTLTTIWGEKEPKGPLKSCLRAPQATSPRIWLDYLSLQTVWKHLCFH